MLRAVELGRILWLVCLCAFIMPENTSAQLIWSSGTFSGYPVNGSGTWSTGTYFFDLLQDTYTATPLDVIQFGALPYASLNKYTVTLGNSTEVAGLVFSENYSLNSASPFTLTLGSSGISIGDGAASIGGGTSALRVRLGAEQTWSNQSASGGVFQVGANVDFNGKNLTLDGSASTSTVLSGSLALGNATMATTGSGNTTISGTVSITGGTLLLNSTGSTLLSGILNGGSLATLRKQNTGALTVTNVAGLNAFGGGITLSDGSLILAADTNVAAAGANLTTENLGAPTIVVKQNTTGANRTITLGGLNLGPQDLTVLPANGNGLVFAGSSWLGDGGYGISVSGVQASNVLPGLTFSGTINGTGTFKKKGTGTMLLTNSANTFGAGTGFFEITDGILAATSDEALGPVGNTIRINTGSATKGFRAAGDITTSRTFMLDQASSGIEVVSGKTLKLLTPFVLGAGSFNLQKNDNGTLDLAAGNAAWSGALTIAAGAVRISDVAALGSGTGATTVSGSGAALQFNGSFSTAEPLSLNGAGIHSAGALQAVSGASTLSGTVTLTAAATVGAYAGAALTLTGSLTGAQALTFAGAGTVTVAGTLGAVPTSLTQMGSGKTQWLVGGTAFTGALNVNAGVFTLSDSGRLGATGGNGVEQQRGVDGV